jgi:CheY-like chemotaxis protein
LDSEVDSTPDEPDVEKLRIEVSDTGIGIDPRITGKMFESFVRARSSEHTVSGTGLGLSIVQKMSELLGGSVRVNANPQGGSRFIVTLPILLGDAESAEVQHEPVVSSPCLMPNESMKSLRNSRILIVDDNPENRLLFRFMIEKFGAQSEYAINGADAVDRIVTTLKTNPFDAILMDVQMPIMDGRSATRHLREIGVETPIIALTAHASKSEKNAWRVAPGSLTSPPIRQYRN